jgi:hypothetical protein
MPDREPKPARQHFAAMTASPAAPAFRTPHGDRVRLVSPNLQAEGAKAEAAETHQATPTPSVDAPPQTTGQEVMQALIKAGIASQVGRVFRPYRAPGPFDRRGSY